MVIGLSQRLCCCRAAALFLGMIVSCCQTGPADAAAAEGLPGPETLVLTPSDAISAAHGPE